MVTILFCCEGIINRGGGVLIRAGGGGGLIRDLRVRRKRKNRIFNPRLSSRGCVQFNLHSTGRGVNHSINRVRDFMIT